MLNAKAKDLTVRFAAGMVSSHDRAKVEKMAKGMMVLCWKILPPIERRRFMSRVDITPEAEFVEFEKRWPDLDDARLESAARSWGYVLPNLTGEDRQFALSIQTLLKRRGKPSEKQAAWMKRLYEDWKAAQDFDGDLVE